MKAILVEIKRDNMAEVRQVSSSFDLLGQVAKYLS
jgi:hypothetical protein